MAALRELVEGECGAANPLVQWSDHFQQQKSLSQGGGVGGDRLREIARHRDPGQLENELVAEFLGNGRPAVPQTFNMSSLLAEVQQQQPHISTLSPSPLSHHATTQDSSVREWVDEFAPPPHPPLSSSSSSHLTTVSSVPESWAQEYSHDQTDKQAHDWAEEFRDQVESKGLVAAAKEMSEAVTDPKIQATEFMDFVRKLGKGEGAVEGDEVKGKTTDAKWVGEYLGTEGEEEEEEAGYWGQLEKEWQELSKQNTHPWLDDFAGFSEQKDYQFSEDNHLKEVENALEEGKRRLSEGDLPSAVLLFEAEVQRNPDSIEGWQYLGITQANNEQEHAAIAALHRCLQLSPSNLSAHLALAVSYTNESQHNRALESLRNWLYHNPKYRHLAPESGVAAAGKPHLSSFMAPQEHKDVCDLFLKAAQTSPETLDPDIQVCLGVLYNLSNEFDKAVDCFTAALQTRPDDALLWNKLGATLANSSRSEEAVHAYRQALAHMPGFTRCRYNLGISCINLRAYQEGAEHFLTALNHQRQATGTAETVGEAKVGVAQMSETIWSTLRLAVSFLGRSSLIPILEARNLDTLLAEFGLATK
ncbi:Peroxisomal targeting signal 1 receptor [Geodia barretti]|uniref:Peroxisomal targeting signal 1 receptor n=1 Tax=Geodia barretti TaxID=519541 RepID=A0AA35R4U3_GEOBA|nr:Peroxisomal targeting signal 1 receptor [Geodia barretti]